MNYIERIINWFEERAQQTTNTLLTPQLCQDIANRMRADFTPHPPPGVCAKPGQHAPGCDCTSLMKETYDP